MCYCNNLAFVAGEQPFWIQRRSIRTETRNLEIRDGQDDDFLRRSDQIWFLTKTKSWNLQKCLWPSCLKFPSYRKILWHFNIHFWDFSPTNKTKSIHRKIFHMHSRLVFEHWIRRSLLFQGGEYQRRESNVWIFAFPEAGLCTVSSKKKLQMAQK